MKFWKNGFYFEQDKENSRIEITDELYTTLLEGQSNGKIIISNANGYPVLTDYKRTNLDEITDIKDWFNNVYSYKEQKLRRLNTLNKTCENGNLPYDELIALYNEAELKRARLQELEATND